MSSKPKINNPSKAKRIAHIIAASVILLNAFEKFLSGNSSYIVFVIAGLVFLSVAIFHSRIAKRFPRIDGFFFGIEALLSIFVAIDFFLLGKKALPFVYLVAALFQVFMVFKIGRSRLQEPIIASPDSITPAVSDSPIPDSLP